MKLEVDNITTENASGTIKKGARSIGIVNTGEAAGIFNGQSLPSGVSVSLPPISGCEYPEINYDATGTKFLITIIK